MIGYWNSNYDGPIMGSCEATCVAPWFGADVNNYVIPSNKVCVLPPPNCITLSALVLGECAICAPGYFLNLNNNLCTWNAIGTGCLIAEPGNAANCVLCKAGSTEDTQYVLNATTKQCSLDPCALGKWRTLSLYTPVLISHPAYLQDRTLY